MRALVSGANGFIGRALVARLEHEGVVVCRVVRGDPAEGQASLNLRDRHLDTSRLPGDGLNEIETVFHLAGEPISPRRWNAQKRAQIRDSRVISTEVLANAISMCTNPPRAFVCASAIGWYGDRGEELLDENSPPGEGFLAEVCRQWEAAAASASAAGTRVVQSRTGVVLGLGGGLLEVQARVFGLGVGGNLGRGKHWMSWISLEDEISALCFAAATESLSGPCNLTAPNPVRNAQFTKLLAHALHRPALLPIPALVLRAVLGEQVAEEMVLASQRVQPTRLEASGFVFADPDLQSFLQKIFATKRH